ncbi:hypothetical protein BGZ60DRAFT_409540 [Tricladium varicosporioides]|nr:hypothetical protein BGZ60DRAFT_409540 [Hymenoscyphus varicosporioides]
MADQVQIPIAQADHHAAKLFVCITAPLFTLSLITLTARIVLKVRSGLHIGWDDGLILVGFVFAIAEWTLLLVGIAACIDPSRSFTDIAGLQQVIKVGVLAVPLWICSMACIKISVAVLLLRFQQNTIWKRFLHALIGLLVLSSACFFLFDLLQCRPLAATWDTSITGAKCTSANTFRIVSNVTSGFNIATDVILSLFPLTFLLKLRRPVTEKVLVIVLMGMGMAASGASITKAVLVQQWVNEVYTFSMGFSISTWTCVELFIGMTAACLPSLKPMIQRGLAALGINFAFTETHSFFQSINHSAAEAGLPQPHNENGGSRNNVPLRSIKLTNSTQSSSTEEGGKENIGGEERKKDEV